jgi:hypothetical protein
LKKIRSDQRRTAVLWSKPDSGTGQLFAALLDLREPRATIACCSGEGCSWATEKQSG